MHGRRGAAAGLVAASLALGLLAAPSSASTPARGPSGTVTVALPGGSPSQIFPFEPCAYYDERNVKQFQQLMYRPLYWFGLGSSRAIQYPLSLAAAPVASARDQQFTLDLKGWKFSDGQAVDAESVAFFLNLDRADPAGLCGYAAGFGLADLVKSVTYPDGLSGDTVVLGLASSVSPTWFLDDDLSQVTPMPEAWDVSANHQGAGEGGCATATYGSETAATDCAAVRAFLQFQSDNPNIYPLRMWQTVDGPWRLRAFSDIGRAIFVPNPSYSGPQKPLVAELVEKQYAVGGDLADLEAGRLELGFMDPKLLHSVAPAPGEVGTNLAALRTRYVLVTAPTWGFNAFTINFHSSDPNLPVVDQPYIRQSLQAMVPQAAIIRQDLDGYGTPSCSPVPFGTPSSIAAVSCLDAYNPVRALDLLKHHGWRLEDGVQTCVRPGSGPGHCGAGIPGGDLLRLQLQGFAGTSSSQAAIVASELRSELTIGIVIQPVFYPGLAACGPVRSLCERGGWSYTQEYNPSGESLFTKGARYNLGGYSDAKMTSLISNSTKNARSLTAYAHFAAQQVPVLYEPLAIRVYEVSRALQCARLGACAQSPLGDFMPEYYR